MRALKAIGYVRAAWALRALNGVETIFDVACFPPMDARDIFVYMSVSPEVATHVIMNAPVELLSDDSGVALLLPRNYYQLGAGVFNEASVEGEHVAVDVHVSSPYGVVRTTFAFDEYGVCVRRYVDWPKTRKSLTDMANDLYAATVKIGDLEDRIYALESRALSRN